MPHARDIFGHERALVGMVHVGALPGTPRQGHAVREIASQAVEEAVLLARSGFDAILLENMHDVPYLKRHVGPEIVASMTAIVDAVRDRVDVPLGVQILAGANREALAVAHAAGAEFIRAEGFVFASVADEGLLADADAGRLLRYRRAIGADDVRILVDIKKKHSAHAITDDLDIGETARAAEFFGADGIVVTGVATGRPVQIEELGVTRVATTLPVIVGSGVTPERVADLLAYADALIVGSWFKRDGLWSNPPDPDRVQAMVDAVKQVR